VIYDQIITELSPAVIDELSSGKLDSAVTVSVLLEIDLQHLVYWDQFVGENFIRCIFRYYPALSSYIKEVFLHKLQEDQLMFAVPQTDQPAKQSAISEAHRRMINSDGRTFK